MKKFTNIFITSCCFLIAISTVANAQSSRKSTKAPFIKSIDSFVNGGFKSDELQDSIALYAVNFRVDLIKKNDGKIEIAGVSVNDSLAYKLFPSYKKLYTIDYRSVIGTRKKTSLIIPILISNISATAKKRYVKNDGSDLIDMNAAVNAAFAVYSTIKYDNRKESNISLYERIYRSKNYRAEQDFNPNKVFLSPYFIEIVNIR